jgi:hypothetical protein
VTSTKTITKLGQVKPLVCEVLYYVTWSR